MVRNTWTPYPYVKELHMAGFFVLLAFYHFSILSFDVSYYLLHLSACLQSCILTPTSMPRRLPMRVETPNTIFRTKIKVIVK